MLNGKLELHGVDAEALVQSIVGRANLELSAHQRDDLLAYLLGECWRLSLRYEPGRGSTTSFAGWATTNLRLRIVDWTRAEFGRSRWKFHDHTHERSRPRLVSLDADRGGDRLVDALGTRAGDPTADRTPDLERLLGEGGSARARDYEVLGLRPPRRATD